MPSLDKNKTALKRERNKRLNSWKENLYIVTKTFLQCITKNNNANINTKI